MTNTLKSKITFSNGGADQSNFFDYPLLRIDEMPEIVPHPCSPSDRPPQGAGEVMLAPVAPAIAQALLHATGRRLDVDAVSGRRVPGDVSGEWRALRGSTRMSVKFLVNGKPAEFDGPDDVPLLWVVREHLGLTGSKFGCGVGACGACTMHIDGAPSGPASCRS